jgi:hypothetical protein
MLLRSLSGCRFRLLPAIRASTSLDDVASLRCRYSWEMEPRDSYAELLHWADASMAGVS